MEKTFKELEAEIKERTEAIMSNMVELKGSEKQVAWAKKIRAHKLGATLSLIDVEVLGQNSDGAKWYTQLEELCKNTSAAWFIENR